MKKFFLTFTMISIISFSNAQYDITDFASNNLSFFSIDNLSEYLHYSSNFSNTVAEALHTVDLSSVSGPDTIFFPVSIDNEIVPLTGLNTTQDTLTIEIAVGYWGNNNSAIRTNNADFTVKNSFNSYDYIDCLLYTSPSPRDGATSRMPSSA